MQAPPKNTTYTPPQQEIVDHGLLTSGFSCVLQLPTGAGKTWLAEQAIASTLRQGGRAIYLTPLRALANELVARWQTVLSDHEVGVFTGEYGARRPYPVPFDRAQLLIMTPERLDACTRQWRAHWSWIPDVDLVVVDELHLLADRGRGPRLEGALCRFRRLNPFAQVLGLSATLGNTGELADWLDGVYYKSDWRPLPIEWRVATFRNATEKPAILEREVRRCVAAGGQSLVFVQSRRRAEQLSVQLRDAGLSAAHHHAGLQSEARSSVEDQYRRRQIKVLVATATLEMGVNLPARQVVLYDLQGFNGQDFVPLTVNTVWQRAGRAGRRGLDDSGEVVLIAPSWDRSATRYLEGRFESIRSGLGRKSSLSEQILAEVASGLCRTHAQVERSLRMSLAHHQGTLSGLDQVLEKMLESGMLAETVAEDGVRPRLKATRLGRIAVRQMLSPETVLLLARAIAREDAEPLTLFDILLIAAATPDCSPLIPADFEELDTLSELLATERSVRLSATPDAIRASLAVSGRHLLACIKTSLVARAWTRSGDADAVAEQFACYPFEVRRLAESLERILTAAVAVATPPKKAESDEEEDLVNPFDVEPSLRERLQALSAMVTHGLDEEMVTLTFVPGIGGTLARRLVGVGISNIEDLCLADPEELATLRGISSSRAEVWISAATELIDTRSALAFREDAPVVMTASSDWPSDVDPYRLRRATELAVKQRRSYRYSVSGGLEPHLVVVRPERSPECDCADFHAGNHCKHLLAVRLHRGDSELLGLRDRVLQDPNAVARLDLFALWFDRNTR